MLLSAPSRSDDVLRTVVAGGALGALVSWFYALYQQGNHEEKDKVDVGPAMSLLHTHKLVCADGVLYVALQEPVSLFYKLDLTATRGFLNHLEALMNYFSLLRGGGGNPGDIGQAIKQRREANIRLRALQRLLRRSKPMAASDLEEDILTIQKIMDGCIHNCMQQSNVNILEHSGDVGAVLGTHM